MTVHPGSVVVDHPIPQSHIDQAFALSAEFFDLPQETKAKTPWNGKNMGWEFKSQVRPSTGYADPKESIQLGFGQGPDMTASWPSDEDLPGWKARAQAFQTEVQQLSVKLMELLAEGVGLVSSRMLEEGGYERGSSLLLTGWGFRGGAAYRHLH